MKTTLRGLVLAICFALPRAEATTVTFGPQHSSTFLDITLDISDGFWTDYGSFNRVWHTPRLLPITTDDWSIGGDFGWAQVSGSFTVVNKPLFRGFMWAPVVDIFWVVKDGVVVPSLALGSGNKIYNLPWEGAIPIVQGISNTTIHITWDAYAPAVPDNGNAFAMFGSGLIALFGLHHRRKNLNSPTESAAGRR